MMTLMPPHRPSNPSIRLTALVMPVIQKNVTMKETTPMLIVMPSGSRMTSSVTPEAISTIAATT